MKRTVRVSAHANIALAKYWGKADIDRNLPAVPSLSLTLDGLKTTTELTFDDDLPEDSASLDGVATVGRPLARIVALLDEVRTLAGLEARARVVSHNDFPTAAGLASSASGFAALALAATTAAGLDLSRGRVSALARQASASAARSLWGGYVALPLGADEAEPVAPASRLPLHMLVAVTATGPKKIGSTEGMKHTARTSPYYPAWVTSAPAVYEEVKAAILSGDVARLGEAVEHSALAMHASMLAARPAVRYFAPATLAVLDRVQALREGGTVAYATMDAGPHVKVLTTPDHVDAVERALTECDPVQRVIRCGPGPDARILESGVS